MMKKITSILIVLVLSVSLIGCSSEVEQATKEATKDVLPQTAGLQEELQSLNEVATVDELIIHSLKETYAGGYDYVQTLVVDTTQKVVTITFNTSEDFIANFDNGQTQTREDVMSMLNELVTIYLQDLYPDEVFSVVFQNKDGVAL
jgi:hypothetical protein